MGGARGRVWRALFGPIVAVALGAATGCANASPDDAEPLPLPDARLFTFDGDSTMLRDHVGKVLLVNFWASWCAPCERELPVLKQYYPTLPRDRVEFIAISADETRGAALEFIERFDVPFPTFYGGSAMSEVFGFYGLPYSLIVDPQGRIVDDVLGFGSVESWEYVRRTLEREIARAARLEDD